MTLLVAFCFLSRAHFICSCGVVDEELGKYHEAFGCDNDGLNNQHFQNGLTAAEDTALVEKSNTLPEHQIPRPDSAISKHDNPELRS